MNGYKIFDQHFRCRGLQYRVGETQKHEGPIELCKSGLHFCELALNCIQYYSLSRSNRYAEVCATGRIITKQDKSVTEELTVVRELSFAEFANLCTGAIIKKHKWKHQTKSKTYYKNGVRDGRYREWDENEKLRCDFMYANGVQDGPQIKYFGNGVTRWECTFVQGRKHGLETMRYESGGFYSTRAFTHGNLDGEYKMWHPNGVIWVSAIYKNGLLSGEQQLWYQSGKLQSHGTYNDGRKEGTHRIWYVDGQLSSEIVYDGFTTTEKHWRKNGELQN